MLMASCRRLEVECTFLEYVLEGIYGYQKEHLSYLFDSIILSLFLYGIEIWGSALQKKYLDRVDRFFKRAHRYGYVLNEYKMSELIEMRDRTLFNKILDNPDHVGYFMNCCLEKDKKF